MSLGIHTAGSRGAPGDSATCRSGNGRHTCRGSAMPMRTLLRIEGLAARRVRSPGVLEARRGGMPAALDVGANTA